MSTDKKYRTTRFYHSSPTSQSPLTNRNSSSKSQPTRSTLNGWKAHFGGLDNSHPETMIDLPSPSLIVCLIPLFQPQNAKKSPPPHHHRHHHHEIYDQMITLTHYNTARRNAVDACSKSSSSSSTQFSKLHNSSRYFVDGLTLAVTEENTAESGNGSNSEIIGLDQSNKYYESKFKISLTLDQAFHGNVDHFVNGKRIEKLKEFILHHGDVILVNNCRRYQVHCTYPSRSSSQFSGKIISSSAKSDNAMNQEMDDTDKANQTLYNDRSSSSSSSSSQHQSKRKLAEISQSNDASDQNQTATVLKQSSLHPLQIKAQEDIFNDIKCPICFEIIVNATTNNPCGHIFCYPCISSHVNNHHGQTNNLLPTFHHHHHHNSKQKSMPSCPSCRKDIHGLTKTKTYDQLIYNMICMNQILFQNHSLCKDNTKEVCKRNGEIIGDIECYFERRKQTLSYDEKKCIFGDEEESEFIGISGLCPIATLERQPSSRVQRRRLRRQQKRLQQQQQQNSAASNQNDFFDLVTDSQEESQAIGGTVNDPIVL